MVKEFFATLKAHHCRLQEPVAVTEAGTQSLQFMLKRIELSIRSALITRGPDFDHQLIWSLATVIDIDTSDLLTGGASEQCFPGSQCNTQTEWSSMLRARPFIIREEEHPLKPGISIFRVYTENMQPVSIERKSVGEAETDLRNLQLVSSITVLYLEHQHEVTSSGRSTNLMQLCCTREGRSYQCLLPNNYSVCASHGYYACMKYIDDDWFFFPADGPAFVANWNDAKWYKDRQDAIDFILQYIENEEKERGI